MIRRSPAELYLKYLTLHPKKYTNEQIEEICLFADVDFLGHWYIDRLRQQLKPPVPFHPRDKFHKPSYSFLLSNGLSWIFFRDKHSEMAFKVLESPRVKEYVEAGIASSAPSVAIAHALTRFQSFPCVAKDIDRYREFFWNIDLLDSTELRAALRYKVERLEKHSNPEIAAQYKSVKAAYYKDARKSAADLPFSPVGAMLAQMRMGMMPSELDVNYILKQTRVIAYMRTTELIHFDGPGDSKKALDYMTVGEKAENVLREMADPQAQMLDQLATISMRTDDTPIPTIHQLSQGQHTAEVVKMETTHELSADIVEGDGGDDSSFEPE